MTVSDIDSGPAGLGTSVLLTGPTRGLGLATALELARKGCRMVLVGRTSPLLRTAAASVRSAGAASVTVVEVDMASLASVSQASDEVTRLVQDGRLPPIEVVVANAGVQLGDRQQASTDGIELTFAVNVVANYRLLTGLLPALADNAHCVVVGSGTHFGGFPTSSLVAAPVWADPGVLAQPGAELPVGRRASDARAGQCAYSTSKLAVNYLAHELQRRLGNARRVNVYDPGMMPGTALARDLAPWKRWAWNHILPALVPVIPGAARVDDSARYLASFALGETYPEARWAYIEIDKLTRASDASYDEALEFRLWEFCQSLTGGEGTRPPGS